MKQERINQITNDIAKQIKDAFQKEISCLSFNVPVDEAEDTASLIGQKLCFSILCYTLRNYPACFCGRRKICRTLKQQFGGKVKYNGFYYLWIGTAEKNELIKTISNLQTENNSKLIIR